MPLNKAVTSSPLKLRHTVYTPAPVHQRLLTENRDQAAISSKRGFQLEPVLSTR